MRWVSAILISFAAVPWAGADGPAPFTEEAAARGVVYTMQPWPVLYGYLGYGCGFADLDGDRDPDIVILGAADGHVGLFENTGGGEFVDRSGASGVPVLPGGSAFVTADYDADGDLDLFLTQVGHPNQLLRNEGAWTFTNVTSIAGVGDPGAGKAAVFGDYSGDGYPDLYVCNYQGILAGSLNLPNRLYRNRADGSFVEVGAQFGADDTGHGFQAVWFDYDRDHDLDLYLSNDRGHLPPHYHGNQLWRNDGGTLLNVSVGSGADVALFSMGVACGDFDGNRWPDLYCTNVGNYPGGFNPLLLNQGDGTFVEASAGAGVDDWITSWGAIFFDWNNDTVLDLYVNNMFEPNVLFDCSGGWPCVEIAHQVGVAARPEPSFAAAVADVDADGDLDLLVNNLAGAAELFINHEGATRRWVRCRVQGSGANTHAIGARVDIRLGNQWQMAEVLAGGNGYLGQNEAVCHFGAGDALTVDELVVTWPGGVTRTLVDYPTNAVWELLPVERLGDASGDGVVGPADLAALSACLSKTVQPGCEVMDFNGDAAVDVADVDAFLRRYRGPKRDCDHDRRNDVLEIILGTLIDDDGDGLADDCGPWAAPDVPPAVDAGPSGGPVPP